MASIDYGKIINRSKVLTLKNKWLWVYGLVLAALGGGGSGSGSSSGSSSSSDKSRTIQSLPKDVPEKTKEVLGAATSAIQSWATSIPISTWLLIGFGLLILVLVGMAFSVFVQNWAKGALIAGVEDAENEKPVSLKTTSTIGVSNFKALFIYGLKMGLLVFGIILLTLMIFGVGLLALSQSPAAMIIWGLVVGGIGLIVILATILITSFASVFAERLIVLHGFTRQQAFKKGFSLAKGNFFPTMVMGLINSAVGCTIGCVSSLAMLVVLGIPAAVILVPAFSNGFHMPSPPAIAVLGLLVFIFTQLNLLVNAGMVVFNYSNWNIFVKEILRQEKSL